MAVFRKNGVNLLYVHVPKTGGGTIESVFARSGWTVDLLDEGAGNWSLNHLRQCSPQHMEADLLKRTLRLDRFDGILMTVRDPIRRFQSEYLWHNRPRRNSAVRAPRVEWWADEVFAQYARDPYVHDNHIRPQAEFLLEGAKVYRYESGMTGMISQMQADFGVELDPNPPHKHRSKGYQSSDVELSPRVLARLRDFYAADFRAFGYAETSPPTDTIKAVSPAGDRRRLLRAFSRVG